MALNETSDSRILQQFVILTEMVNIVDRRDDLNKKTVYGKLFNENLARVWILHKIKKKKGKKVS